MTGHRKDTAVAVAVPRHSHVRFRQARELLSTALTFASPADKVIERYFKSHREMGSQDRKFAAETVYGCLRQRRTLLKIIEPLCVPQDAAEEAPWLLATYLAQHAGWSGRILADAGFAGDSSALIMSVRQAAPAQWTFAEQHSLPDWLAEALLAQLGAEDAANCALALNLPAPVDLRVNTQRTDREQLMSVLIAEGFDCAATLYSPVGIRRTERGPLFNTKAFREGLFEMQDEGSQLVSLLAQAKPRQRVIDFCAGAGGKTLHLANQMQNRGEIIACDTAAWRLTKMRERLRRGGVDNVRLLPLTGVDDPVLNPLRETADVVLVDAPCSGSGTLRRNPDIKWKAVDLPALANLQCEILAAASTLVKPGGRLVYATCSLLDVENSHVGQAFLATHPQFRLGTVADVVSAGLSAELLTSQGELQLLPHRHHTDGFYAALLIRD